MAKAVSRVPRFVYLWDDATGRNARYGWRLMAANNRALARGAQTYTSLAQCRSAAAELQAAMRDDRFETAAEAENGRWIWRISLDRRTVASSINSYFRRIECMRAFKQFVAAIHEADPNSGVTRSYGLRTLREFDRIDVLARSRGGGSA